MAIMSSMQGKHQRRARLYIGSKIVSHSATVAANIDVRLPALLNSYNIINDIFVQIWKHPCEGSE